jgi:hypothetical protein
MALKSHHLRRLTQAAPPWQAALAEAAALLGGTQTEMRERPRQACGTKAEVSPLRSRRVNLRRLIEARRGLTEPFGDKTAEQAALAEAAAVLGATQIDEKEGRPRRVAKSEPP